MFSSVHLHQIVSHVAACVASGYSVLVCKLLSADKLLLQQFMVMIHFSKSALLHYIVCS